MVRQYLTGEANALVSSRPVCPVSTCANSCVSRRHLLWLSQIVMDTHQHLLFSRDSIGCHLYYCCIFKMTILVYKFLHTGHPCYFGSHLFIHCGWYCTRYNHPDKRFLDVQPLISFQCSHSWEWFNWWCLFSTKLLPASGKAKIISLQKGLPNLANKLPSISVVLTWLYLWNNYYCLGRDWML